MGKIGYFLACEEWGSLDLLNQARMAEEAGFEALWISDHYHPWISEQGESSFVWSVIGGLSQVTSLPVITGVYHRRYLPYRSYPPCHRSPGSGDLGGDARRSLRAGGRLRREPE